MQNNLKQHPILILDYGSQYTQLIARRLRELQVYCEIHPWDISFADIQALHPCGIILSGGPETVLSADAPTAPSALFEADYPILGICYGLQLMAQTFGAQVIASNKREFGKAKVNLLNDNVLFEAIQEKQFTVWMSHGDAVNNLPNEFNVIAKTDNAPYAAISHNSKPFYGVQFHPEVTHSEFGTQLLSNFVFNICHADNNWTLENITARQTDLIKAQVGTDHVVLGLSGGVDSAVVAALLHPIIGDQLTCIFVDTGLLRHNEAEMVVKTFRDAMHVKLIVVNAEAEFMAALKDSDDPEQKRKIIGNLFIEIFEREANKIPNAKWLAQGTIYPDVIESAASKTGKAKVIKSHHNVGGLPERMQLKLLEPLRELFKDEVRRLGLSLGLPAQIINRHPFPGPGLAVRILGAVDKAKADILRQADHIFITTLIEHDLYSQVSQAFAVFLPVKSVGVVGDARQYEYVIALRAVETSDFMTARWASLPYDFLADVSNKIVNEVRGVSRVVYDVTGKPPATIEWE